MSKPLLTEPPGPRVCRGGCSPEIQPLENFYARGLSANGYRTHDNLCKVCTRAAEKKRYAALPKGPRKKVGGYMPPGKPLWGWDVVPCDKCGLRGHPPGDPEKCAGATKERSTGLGARGEEWAL